MVSYFFGTETPPCLAVMFVNIYYFIFVLSPFVPFRFQFVYAVVGLNFRSKFISFSLNVNFVQILEKFALQFLLVEY